MMIPRVNRELVTSLTAWAFVVIGVTGVLMYVHLFERQVKELHEVVGLAFVAVAGLHLFFNWGSMKRYVAKRHFASSAVLAAAVTLGFVATAADIGNPKTQIVRAVISAPIEHSAVVLGSDPETAGVRLASAGLRVEEGASIASVAKANHLSAFDVVGIITANPGIPVHP